MKHIKNNIIFETEHWIVKLADDQYFLGRCVIDIKRDVGNLRSLTSEEWKDFEENIVKKLEELFIKLFRPEMFNWNCFMNNTYKPDKIPPRPQVHWHFRPRYRDPIEFARETFDDKIFGHNPKSAPTKRVSQKVFDKIKEEILNNLD